MRAADIEYLQLLQRQRLDRRAAPPDSASLSIAGEVGIQSGFMRDDRYAVRCDRDVQLERCHAQLHRMLERCQGVFGHQPAGAPVALQVERLRLQRQPCQAGWQQQPEKLQRWLNARGSSTGSPCCVHFVDG